MKLTFDAKNDFDSTYYLPGYGCEVHIEVKDGIISLNIEDDGWEKEEFVYGNKVDDSYDILDEEWKDDDFIDDEMEYDSEEEWDEYDGEEVEEENLDNDLYKGENVVGDFDSCTTSKYPKEYYQYGFTCDYKKREPEVEVEVEKDTTATTEMSAEEKFVRKLAKVDKDGVVMNLLTSLIKSGKVSDPNSKVSKSFKKILNNIGELLKEAE